MKREKTWKEKQIDSLRFDFGLYAERWENTHDDRRVMSNTYFMLIEGLESLPANPPAWVCVAIRKTLQEEESRMKNVIRRYQEGLWGEPEEVTIHQTLERWPGILRNTIAV